MNKRLTPHFFSVLAGALAAVLYYLQAEDKLGHTAHVVIGALLVFFTAVGVNLATQKLNNKGE